MDETTLKCLPGNKLLQDLVMYPGHKSDAKQGRAVRSEISIKAVVVQTGHFLVVGCVNVVGND